MKQSDIAAPTVGRRCGRHFFYSQMPPGCALSACLDRHVSRRTPSVARDPEPQFASARSSVSIGTEIASVSARARRSSSSGSPIANTRLAANVARSPECASLALVRCSESARSSYRPSPPASRAGHSAPCDRNRAAPGARSPLEAPLGGPPRHRPRTHPPAAPGALGPVAVSEQRARPARGIVGGARTERNLIELAQPAQVVGVHRRQWRPERCGCRRRDPRPPAARGRRSKSTPTSPARCLPRPSARTSPYRSAGAVSSASRRPWAKAISCPSASASPEARRPGSNPER